jgi:hypothetical protein
VMSIGPLASIIKLCSCSRGLFWVLCGTSFTCPSAVPNTGEYKKGQMKKAPMSKRELRLMAEVKRLKKRIEENNILMHEVAVKIEDIEAARLALEESRQTQVK